MLQADKIKYQDGNIVLEGYSVIDTSHKGKRPAVLICHDWSGRNEFAEKKAQKLAEMGYVGFALDMYGAGKLGKTMEEKKALMNPLANDRSALRARVMAAYEALKNIPTVDMTKIAVIGFCFGGLCALDLARSGVDIKAAVSFHGLLHKPDNLPDKQILAKILVLHGHDDPMVPPEAVLAFENEMTKAHVDWQVYVYGGTQHAFTNPEAHDVALGLVYNDLAEKRSWLAMKNLFSEVF